jgi:hypothetical protein
VDRRGGSRTSRRSAFIPRTPTSSGRGVRQHGAPNEERGVFKTTDGGKTWKKVLYRDDKTGAIDIRHRTNPNVLYATVGGLMRRA